MEDLISSPQNPRIKNLVRLREGKHRRRQKRFIIEGLREIQRAIDAHAFIREFYSCEELWVHHDAIDLADRVRNLSQVEAFAVSEPAFRKASARENPDGLLAVAEMPQLELDSLQLAPSPFIVVLERVEKPGNLGAILRSADAAGVNAIILTDPATDLYSPQTIRSSQGSVFSLPIAVSTNEETLAWLQGRNISIVASTPSARSLYWDVALRGPIAIVMGSEDTGLTPFWLENPKVLTARIPMQGAADSLNVSAAAAIFLFEALRQRIQSR